MVCINDELKKIQSASLEMLIEIDNICRKHNLTYYLAYGTALGAVRHKGFIPWDTDIDIIVMINEYNRLCDILYNELSDKFVIHWMKTDANYEELFARVALEGNLHHIIHVDIFPLIGVPRNRIIRKLFMKICYLNHRCYFIEPFAKTLVLINQCTG